MTGDVIDFETRRKALKEIVEQKEEEELTVVCPKCEDTLFWVVNFPDASPDEPYALVCQHCYEPVGYGYFFIDDDDDDEE